MSIAESLKAILTAATELPCAQNQYTGSARTYIVYVINTRPDDHADDDPQHEVYSVVIYLYAPVATNMSTLRKAIKHALTQNGYMYPEVNDVSDDDGQQLAFYTSIAAEVE